MSYRVHMKGYEEHRTLYQIDRLHAWKHGQYFPPVIVEINPTHSCNQLCRYCYTHRRGDAKTRLRDDVLISVFDQIADAGVNAVVIQGTGEPLLHKALAPAVQRAGDKDRLSIGLTTNGVLFDESIQDVMLEHLAYVRLSVMDSDPNRYAYLHGCSPRQWDKLVTNIKRAVATREKRGLPVALWGTVYLYSGNFLEAYNIVKFFKECGLDYVVVQEATYFDGSPAGEGDYASNNYSQDQQREMREQVLTLTDGDFRVKVRFPLNDDTYFVGMTKETWKDNFCHGVQFYAVVSCDGNIYPCWRGWGDNSLSYGSLYESVRGDLEGGEA